MVRRRIAEATIREDPRGILDLEAKQEMSLLMTIIPREGISVKIDVGPEGHVPFIQNPRNVLSTLFLNCKLAKEQIRTALGLPPV